MSLKIPDITSLYPNHVSYYKVYFNENDEYYGYKTFSYPLQYHEKLVDIVVGGEFAKELVNNLQVNYIEENKKYD